MTADYAGVELYASSLVQYCTILTAPPRLGPRPRLPLGISICGTSMERKMVRQRAGDPRRGTRGLVLGPSPRTERFPEVNPSRRADNLVMGCHLRTFEMK